MNTPWPMVKLGEVLRHRKEFITIDDLTPYKRARVQLHAKGIVLRDDVLGAFIKTKTQQVCRAGEFLVAEIDAKVGGFGIVPDGIDGATVSSHYFLFVVNEPKLDRRFLDYFIRTPTFRDQVEAQGSTNYAAIRPADVLGYEIPLPPLAEQWRIVARIAELAAKIEEARSLRQQATDEAEVLVGARSGTIFRDAAKQVTAPLDSFAVLERGKFSHRPRNDPRFFGGQHPWIQIGEIESAGKEIRHWTETLNDDGLAISKKFQKGTVLISIAATIGSVGILAFDCCVPDSIVGVTPREGTDSEFLYYYLSYLRSHLEEIAPQSAQKNINLQILSPLPVPKLRLDEQRRVVAELGDLQAKVDELKRLQSETAAELDALLPSILDKAFKGAL
jgi:type I restriction enzyme, S subunit